MIPDHLEVKQAEIWKKKDTTKIKDFTQIEIVSDWTYSTPYKGTYSFISNRCESLKNATDLAITSTATSQQKFRIEITQDQIPYGKLGPENPIKHSAQIYLFECDLEDCGYTMAQVRFRIMKDCFFVLFRYYLRVDGVCVRVLDTRIYHEFGTNTILREFKHLESKWSHIKQAGFSGDSDWMLSDTQADEVAPYLEQKLKINDKLYF